MKVGYVVKRYPRYSETFIVNEILAHEEAGMQIHIFSLLPPEDGHFQDIIARVRAPVTYLSTKELKASDFWSALVRTGDILSSMWGSLEAAREEDVRYVHQAVLLAREVRLRGISHLHAHFASATTSVARLAAYFAGIPFTFTAHAKDVYHEDVCTADLRRKLADAAATITVSDYNLEYLRENYGPAAGRVQRIYNGVDLGRFQYEPPDQRPPRIVAVGRLVEKKGFAVLVEASAILAIRGCTFSCQIVGAGEEESELRAQIGRLGLEDRVELLGPRPQSELIDYVRRSAVLAAPCLIGTDGNRDGLPTVLLEAMALGTPCVSTDVTGIPEVLLDEVTGLMVPQDDPAALAQAIELLLEESSLRVRLAERARRLVEEEFDIASNAARVRQVFHEATAATVKAIQEVS